MHIHRVKNLVHAPNVAADWRAVREVRRVLVEIEPALVHAHSSKAGFIARVAAWKTGTPVIFTAHGWAFTKGVRCIRKVGALPMEWVAGRLPGSVIAVSKYDRDLALRYRVVANERITVCIMGFMMYRGGADQR